MKPMICAIEKPNLVSPNRAGKVSAVPITSSSFFPASMMASSSSSISISLSSGSILTSFSTWADDMTFCEMKVVNTLYWIMRGLEHGYGTLCVYRFEGWHARATFHNDSDK